MRNETGKNAISYAGILLMILLAIGVIPWILSGSDSFAAKDSGAPAFAGAGAPADPYRIESAEDLQELAEDVAAGETYADTFFKLTDDIRLPENWEGIGALKEGASDPDKGRNIAPFSGIIDGDGHTVTAADGGSPLLGYVRGATIRDLNIAGPYIRGNGLIGKYVTDYGPSGSIGVKTATVENVTILSGTRIRGSGIVSGYASAGNTVEIIGCTAEEGVVVGCDKDQSWVGSFGGNYNGVITGCRSAATVYGVDYVGGIIGARGNSMSVTSVSSCVFSGQVIASGNYAGGIAGGSYGGMGWGINTAPNAPMLPISDCLCFGSIEAADTVGGILGYETSLQVWENGQGHVKGNLFTGTVRATAGSRTGGIAGAYRGLDRYNFIENNYFSEGCGSDRGIGGAEYVDTSCPTHESLLGDHYFDSSVEIPVFEGVNDKYSHNLRENHNRTDDPLGADAESLAKAVTSYQLADGTVTAWLNAGSSDDPGWIQGENGPQPSAGPMVLGIRMAGEYQSEYYIGDTMDISALEFVLTFSDGSTETIRGDDERLVITGFDSSERAVLTLRAIYGSVGTEFPVRILRRDTGEEVYAYFTLLGDEQHGADGTAVHTRAAGNLQTWIEMTEYRIGANDTAEDLIRKALEDHGLKLLGSNADRPGELYISGVQIPPAMTGGADDPVGNADDPAGGAAAEVYLSEKDNGPNSGWMYAVNDEEPGIGVGKFFLEDGDEVILFYSDDYTKEASALPYIDPDPDDPIDPDPQPAKVIKGHSYKVSGSLYKVTKVASKKTTGTVTFRKAKNRKSVTVPASVRLADGKLYKVTGIGSRAFAGSRAKTVTVKTKFLKKASVKGSLRGSKVKTVRVNVGSKNQNRKYAKKYRKYFTKKNAGKKTVVK